MKISGALLVKHVDHDFTLTGTFYGQAKTKDIARLNICLLFKMMSYENTLKHFTKDNHETCYKYDKTD